MGKSTTSPRGHRQRCVATSILPPAWVFPTFVCVCVCGGFRGPSRVDHGISPCSDCCDAGVITWSDDVLHTWSACVCIHVLDCHICCWCLMSEWLKFLNSLRSGSWTRFPLLYKISKICAKKILHALFLTHQTLRSYHIVWYPWSERGSCLWASVGSRAVLLADRLACSENETACCQTC